MYKLAPWEKDTDEEIRELKEWIRIEYDKMEDLINGKIQTATISTRKILNSIILINYYSCETGDIFWERKKSLDLAKEFEKFKAEIGSILYSTFLYYYRYRGKKDFVCSIIKFYSKDNDYNRYESNTIDSDEMRENGAYSDLKNLYNGITRLIHLLELIYHKDYLLKSRVMQVEKKEKHEKQQTEISDDGSKNIIEEKKMSVYELNKKLLSYKKGIVDKKYLKGMCLPIKYENEFLSFDCYDTSNKKGITSKMWSLIFYPKKDFQHLQNYIELSKITRIKTTKVKDSIGNRCAIRFYDMAKNPNPEIIIDILEYIFGN